MAIAKMVQLGTTLQGGSEDDNKGGRLHFQKPDRDKGQQRPLL